MPDGKPILVEISPDELWNKITERITDATKVQNVKAELAMPELAAGKADAATSAINGLIERLSSINLALWKVEDDIRDCERKQNFGPSFIELARSVYRLNDERGDLKRQINILSGARLVEEKQYARYD